MPDEMSDASIERMQSDSLEAAMSSFQSRLEEEEPVQEQVAEVSEEEVRDSAPEVEPEVVDHGGSDDVPDALPDAAEEPDKAPPATEEAPEPDAALPFDTVIRYKHNREEKQEDLADYLRNPEKYPELVDRWQKGVDYDRQRELADKAREEARMNNERLTQMTAWMEQRGIIRRNPITGQYEEVRQQPQQQPGQAPAQAADPGEARRKALADKMDREGLGPSEIRELISLESKHNYQQFRQQMEEQRAAETREAQERRAQEEQVRQRQELLAQVSRQVEDRHQSLKALYTDPLTGKVDDRSYNHARLVGWSEIQKGGDLQAALSAMDTDARTYHTRAQQILAKMRGRAASPTAAPAVSGSGTPAAAPVRAAQNAPAINLDAPPGQDGITERWQQWERAVDQRST